MNALENIVSFGSCRGDSNGGTQGRWYDPLSPVSHGRDPHDGSNSKARVLVIRFNLSPSDPIT
jgi:hypothetical protein